MLPSIRFLAGDTPLVLPTDAATTGPNRQSLGPSPSWGHGGQRCQRPLSPDGGWQGACSGLLGVVADGKAWQSQISPQQSAPLSLSTTVSSSGRAKQRALSLLGSWNLGGKVAAIHG